MSKKFWMGSFMLLFLSIVVAKVYAVSAVDGFDPNANGNGSVHSIAVQSDGKILVGGCFTKIGGSLRKYIARLNHDGIADATFNAGTDINNSVLAIVAQPNGKILVGGYFTKIGGGTRSYIARLKTNGKFDATFNAKLVNNVNNIVKSIAVQSDGKILVGGYFKNVGNQVGSRVVRLEINGKFDATFNAGTIDDDVESIAVQSDGKILVGGYFRNIGGQPRNHIARLNSDGSVDDEFDAQSPCANAGVLSIVVQSDKKILVGGCFNNIGGQPRNYIARLNEDGSADMAFDAGAVNNSVWAVAVQSDGKILVGGYFTKIGGGTRSYVARLKTNGELDTTFNVGIVDDAVESIAVQSDGNILIGGDFRSIKGQTRNGMARLNPDGTLDATMALKADYKVYSTAIQCDGKILVGGGFSNIGRCIARLNPDGKIDTTFSPEVNNAISSISVQSDGKILIGGCFTNIRDYTGNHTRERIARLNQDGTVDDEFNPAGANNEVTSIAVQSDGKILIGGGFTKIGNETRTYMARLNPKDGMLDDEFDPNADNIVLSILVESDGKILVGGHFNKIGGGTRSYIARLKTNGELDTTFNAGVIDDGVESIAVQSDGKILVSRYFKKVGDSIKIYCVARLETNGKFDATFNAKLVNNVDNIVESIAIQSDGKILIGGKFKCIGNSARNNYIARLYPNGVVDTTFNMDADDCVRSISVQSDGKILVGGDFKKIKLNSTGIWDESRNYIARFTNTGAAFQEISASADGSTITWNRSGAGPELYGVTFEVSTDMDLWTMLGTGKHITGGWEVTDFYPILPKDVNLYVRARGYATGGMYNGSTSMIESVKNIYLSDE